MQIWFCKINFTENRGYYSCNCVIGLVTFGCRVTDAMLEAGAEIIILNRDREVVEKYKGMIRNAYISDAINEKKQRQ